jgi:hypothetical protein
VLLLEPLVQEPELLLVLLLVLLLELLLELLLHLNYKRLKQLSRMLQQ